MSSDNQFDMSMFEDDFTNLDMVAIQFNELYKSLKRSGFTADEALELVGMVMANSMAYIPPMNYDDFDDREIRNEFNDEDGDDFV